MSKLLASEVIDLDDAFLDKIEQHLSKRQKKRQESKKYFTVKEVAKLAKVSTQTILRHINTGLLNAVKTGKSWYISQKNLDEYFKPKTNNYDY